MSNDSNGLTGDLSGRVVAPGEADWDQARQAFNLTLDQRPDLVALPADAEDVARIVRWAAERDLEVAMQRTGHNAEPIGSLEGVVLVRTGAINDVEIDADAASARVGGGALWGDVVPRASELGLAALHGSAPGIGIAGYALGGGVGWYVRKRGLACNSVTAIELVSADGDLVRADGDSEPDLFWALRGGGGSFGAVTALELDLYPTAELFAGALFFPFERAPEVLHAWREWTGSVPEEMTSVGRVLQLPDIPDIPEIVRGQSFSLVEVAFLGDQADGEELVKPLRDLGPGMDTVGMVPPVGLAELHMDPPDPVPYVGREAALAELSAKAIDDFVAAAGPGSGSPLLSAEIRHLGGAAGRAEPGAGALASLEAEFLNYSVGMVVDEASGGAVAAQLERVHEALAPFAASRGYLNFAEHATSTTELFDPETHDRLARVRAQYDPSGRFRANHQIPAAA